LTKKEFTPTIRSEKKLDLKGFHKLDRLKEKDGKILTKLNQSTVVQALSQKLYRNAESGFRELLNNEIRACQIAKDKYGSKNAYIKVSLNTTDRSLTIHGINSQGITIEVLNVLREIGLSITESKKGGRIPFGMGFYGSLKLSDIVIVHSRCIENKESYGVQLKGGLFFEEIQDADFKQTGTRIKVTLKPKTNYEKIIDTLVEVSKTSGIKTYLELKAHNGDISGFESGVHELETTTVRKIFDKTMRDEYSYLTASINNNEVEAYLSIAIGSSGSLQDDRDKKLFLVNSPIEAVLDEQDYDNYDYEAKNDDDDDQYNYDKDDEDEKQKIKYKASKIDEINFYSVVVNMKKESIFPAMQDRERLDPKAEKKLREVVVQLYNEALKTIKSCHTLEDWYDHDHKYFISSDKKDLIDLDKSLDQKTIKLRTLLNTDVISYKEEKDRAEFSSLKYLLDNYYSDKNRVNLFYALKKDKRLYNIIKDNFTKEWVKDSDFKNGGYYTDKGHYFLCLLDEKKFMDREKKGYTKFKQAKNICEHFGFLNAKEYIKEHGLKRIYDEEDEEEEEEEKEDLGKEVSLHHYNYENHVNTIGVEDEEFEKLKPNIIKVNNYQSYNKLIGELSDHYLNLVIDDPSIEQLSDVKSNNDVYQEIKKKSFLTNFGKLTVEEILQMFKKSTDIIFNPDIEKTDFKLINHVPKISPRDKRVSQLYIIGNNKRKVKRNNDPDSETRRRRRLSRRLNRLQRKSTKLSKYIEVDDHSDYFKLGIVLIDNNRKFEVKEENSEDLETYYRDSLTEIETNLEDLIGQESHGYRGEQINVETFDSGELFEKYLNRIKEVSEKIKSITIRELFAKGHDETNYNEIVDQVLKLNKQIETTKIKRKENNYL